ncbi:hypothetical protein HanIR_Chr03g0147341 [Helianthus annuus]|nr:hypothetical protein HanIR_Chr03g0147341 [Helianthus annuus]
MKYSRDFCYSGINKSFDAGFGFVERPQLRFPVIVRLTCRRVIEDHLVCHLENKNLEVINNRYEYNV